MHHKVKLRLDAICQEAGCKSVTEFMQLYESIKPITIASIEGRIDPVFKEEFISNMDMGQDVSCWEHS